MTGTNATVGEPVALIAVACRLPGADDAAAFWKLLADGGDAVGPPPPARRPRRPGGYLDAVDMFDADFFGVTAAEARAMDPQQRLLLELSWHLWEDAGIPAGQVDGGRVGVFIGACSDDYARLAGRAGARQIDAYTMTGTARTFLANRISAALRLRGPSLTIDTGQSSSLVAVHHAVQSVQRGESALAVAGGVQLNLSADSDRVVDALGALSPTGRCRTFDADADGIVRGEGAVLLLFKPLRQALSDGDRIYCTVLSSAVNHAVGDGLTVPSQEGQERLLAEAYGQAGVPLAEVGYVELHGTGTRLGDPIEAAALGSVFAASRDTPLLVGSVKTNIGHLEAAAGAAGLLKVALGLRHRALPASLHHRRPPRGIDLAALRLQVCTSYQDWPGQQPATAGVSSFGLGGTNCHVVLAAAPDTDAGPPIGSHEGATPLVLSARTVGAVREQARRLTALIDSGSLRDIAASLATTRTPLAVRAGVAATDAEQARHRLQCLADATPCEGVYVSDTGPASLAYLFPGQGSQRPGAGLHLYRLFPSFAHAYDEITETMRPLLKDDLLDVLRRRDDLTARLDLAQPALFALQVGIYRVLHSWGLTPDTVLGHSQGEITAAYVCGMISLPDACHLVVERGRLLGGLPAEGAMIAVQAGEDEAREVLAGVGGGADIAAVNSPHSLVVSGEEQAAVAVAEHFRRRGRRIRRLRISRAGHSPLIEPIMDQLHAVAGQLDWRPPTGPTLVSAVTGDVADPAVVTDPGFWPRHLRATVRFGDAVARAHRLGARLFVDIGPGQALSTLAQETLGTGSTVVSALHEDTELEGLAHLVATAHAHGLDIDWPAYFGPGTRRRDLPLYAFQRRRYWLDGHDDPAAGPSTAPPASPPDMAALVRICVRGVLGDPGLDFDDTQTFNEIGMDSRMAVALRNTLAHRIGRDLPATLLFDYPTPASLTAALEDGSPL